MQVAWLKVRNLTLRILAASVMLGREIDHDHETNNGLANDGKKPMHEVLNDLRKQLTQHIHSCQECYSQEYKVDHYTAVEINILANIMITVKLHDHVRLTTYSHSH